MASSNFSISIRVPVILVHEHRLSCMWMFYGRREYGTNNEKPTWLEWMECDIWELFGDEAGLIILAVLAGLLLIYITVRILVDYFSSSGTSPGILG